MKPYLYADENEDIYLPLKHRKVNNWCAIIYDQLAVVFTDENYKPLMQETIENCANLQNFDKLKRKEITALDWLKVNGLNENIQNVVIKNIVLAVLSDFLNFIFESLYCAKRSKMTVAYALLRKPFKDELLILEQILTDRRNFFNRFYESDDPNSYDPSKMTSGVDRKQIVKNSISRINSNLVPFETIIFDLRYDNSCTYGLNALCDQALHIVTGNKNYKTAAQNLNFVFSQDDNLNVQYDHFYTFIPLLLLYSVSVIDEIIFEFLKDENSQKQKTLKEFRRMIGLTLFLEQISPNELITDFEKARKAFSKSLKFVCTKCSKMIKLGKEDFEFFFENNHLFCPSCFYNILDSDEIIARIRQVLQNNAPN